MKKSVQEQALQKGYQVLLENFKRANKTRKEKLVIEAGYKTVDEYKKFLETQAGTKPKETTPKKKAPKVKGPKIVEKVETTQPEVMVTPPVIPTIHNVHILDASGSMDWNNRIGMALQGINTEITELKKDTTVNYTNTFVHFSSWNDIQIDQFLVPMSEARHVTMRTRNSTALRDAIGNTLTLLRDKVKDGEKVIVKVFTDGGENNSRVWGEKQLSDLIEQLKSKGFTVAFVGTEAEVAYAVNNLNIDKSNTLVHDNTMRGVQMSFSESIGATKEYALKSKRGEDVSKGFYKKTGKL